MNVRKLSISAMMCALIVVSTIWLKFPIPGTEIMVTTQVFFVLLCGQILDARYSAYTLIAYLTLGLIGLPVFSAVSGLAVLATPSFGYLLGFPFAAAITSAVRKRSRFRGRRYLASLAGILAEYGLALSYIACLKGLYLNAPASIGMLLGGYCLAFLPADIVKGGLAALLGSRLERSIGHRSM